MHWCSSRGVVTVRGRRADAHNPKTNRGPATAQAPSGTPLCVEEQGLGRTLGTPGKDKPSRAALHARRPPVGISNRVSTGKTSYPPVACKRLRKPTRARATTVWHESNVSWAFKFFSQQAMDCCVGHFRIMLPAALRRIIRSLFAGADLQGSDWRTGLGFGAWARGGRPHAPCRQPHWRGASSHAPRWRGFWLKEEKHQFRRTDASQWWLRPASIR